jgi:hypothetical protein
MAEQLSAAVMADEKRDRLATEQADQLLAKASELRNQTKG